MNAFMKITHLLGLRRIGMLSRILFSCLFGVNNKKTHQQLAKWISQLGIVPTKLAQWCAYFCQVHYKDHVLVNSFKYLQTQCQEQVVQDLDELLLPFENLLYSYEKTPISVGSIAQIYRGKLKTGMEVVIKVKHDKIDQDVIIWKQLFSSALFRQFFSFFRKTSSLTIHFDDFFSNMSQQLDFHQEVSNLQKFYKCYEKNPFIEIPQYVAHDNNVILMQYLSSLNFQEVQSILDADERSYFMLLARIFYQDCVFLRDMIHMDLHNGNWGIHRERKSIVLYDFGWILSDQTDFKKFFIYAHLSRKKTLDFIMQQYDIKDSKNHLQQFVEKFTGQIDTIEAINLVLQEFQKEIRMDNFMFCVLSFCVFVGSLTNQMEEFNEYVEQELVFLKEHDNSFPTLRTLIQKFQDPELRLEIQDYLS